MNIKQKEKGFTIIEVVLVLAIAGLIFSMVFIALPALQRSQRDSQRKTDMSRLEVAVVSYTSNNRGALPTDQISWNSFKESYLTTSGDSFIDPSGANTASDVSADSYVLSPKTDDINATTKFGADTTQNIIYYASGYVCGTDTRTVAKAGTRKVAFRMVLEGGGVHCINN